MKNLALSLMLSFYVLPLPVSASQKENLEELVATHLQVLVSDTVNEGSQNAQVIYKDGKPMSTCNVTPSRQDPEKNWAFCRVTFNVNFEDSQESVWRECQVLFSFDPQKIESTLERNEDHIDDCLETLSESP